MQDRVHRLEMTDMVALCCEVFASGLGIHRLTFPNATIPVCANNKKKQSKASMQVLNTVGTGEDAVGSAGDNMLQVNDITTAQNNCDIDIIIKEFEQKLNVQVSIRFSHRRRRPIQYAQCLSGPCRAGHRRHLV